MRLASILLLLLTACCTQVLMGQKPYFQQQVDYVLRVELNDSTHRLSATAQIDYTNHSPDTLRFIWFHCWPNAYKTEQTALGQQLLENGNTKFYFSGPEQKGYLNNLDFKVDGVSAPTEDHPQHLDIVKLILPHPLPPNKTIRITTPFTVQLPDVFSRSGHGKNNIYQITQWYPKPAVYDRDGWHPMPYLDQGEFYSEFGNYDLSITLPKEYIVAATGQLTDPQEKDALMWIRGLTGKMAPLQARNNIPTGREFKTLHYRADSVHDIAWFASPNYLIQYDTCRLRDGSIKEIWHFYTNSFYRVWKNSLAYSKEALRYYSERVGPYPYPTLSVVESAEGPGGGMEYPMLSVIDPTADTNSLRTVILHEIGHNWFYGALASNERQYPWMDEGLNTYYERSMLRDKRDATEEMLLAHLYQEKQDQPINTPADQFTQLNYAAIAYLKTAKWMSRIERSIGRAKFDSAMQGYFRQWKFKHPAPEDLFSAIQKTSSASLDQYFKLVDEKGPLQPSPRSGWKLNGINGWINNNNASIKNRITAFPAVGYNVADGWMMGAGVTNIKIPMNDLQWLAVPLFGTRSKSLNGIGFINHRWRPNGIWKRIDLGMSFSRFSYDRFTAPNGQKLILPFSKWAPGIRFTWRETPRSSRHRELQFTFFHLNETGYRFRRDTIITNGTDTAVNNYYQTRRDSRNLFQVRYTLENNRKLYPYRLEAQLQGNGQFLRPGITLHQFFNYPKGGGLQLRVFAGGFLPLGQQTILNRLQQSRYYLQMSGPTGEQDYTYNNPFIGRAAFEGIFAQQIMERDGAFKIRTDRLSSPVGRSDQWLIAMNFSSSIPDAWNPLGFLPIRIPLHLFLDIGASGATWTNENEGPRWLYNAGIEVPFLKRSFRLFIPLVYSQPYRDYVKSILGPTNRFGQKISFQFNLNNLNPRNFQNEIDLW